MLGGVRIHPARDGLVSSAGGAAAGSSSTPRRRAAPRGRIGAALVRAACAHALDAGALRFDAHVQRAQVGFFARLGWEQVRDDRGRRVGRTG